MVMKFNSKHYLEYVFCIFCRLIPFKAISDTESLNCTESLTLHKLFKKSTLFLYVLNGQMNAECILIPVL